MNDFLPVSKIKDSYDDNEANEANGYFYSKIFVYILRFYFIFFPMYPLLTKFLGTSLWKDGLYIFCSLVGIVAFSKSKFFITYFIAIICIILFQVFQDYDYWEYLTWFFMGPPLYLYFRYIEKAEYKIDLIILMIIMTLGILFVFLYEVPTNNSTFFSIDYNELDGISMLRDGKTRPRYCFVSPMAFSQYCWFIATTVLINRDINKLLRYVFSTAIIITIFYCNTRAGVFLTILSFGVFFYTKFNLYKVKLYNLLTILTLSFIVILQNVISAQATATGKNENLSDSLRVFYLLDGWNKMKEHFLLGISGKYFSPRYEKWYDFENSWLSFVVCFGVIGIFLIFFLIKNYVFSQSHRYIVFYTIPWLSYSVVFPIFQEQCAVFISWFILAIILNLEKWKYLNNIEDETELQNEEIK